MSLIATKYAPPNTKNTLHIGGNTLHKWKHDTPIRSDFLWKYYTVIVTMLFRGIFEIFPRVLW